MEKLLIKDSNGERSYDLHDGQATVGRAETCTIPIEDPMASRHHCTVERVPEGFRVIDNQSRNGTKVNGKQINSHLLKLGDVINIGDCTLTYQGAAGKMGSRGGSSDGVRGAAGARRRAGGAARGLVGPLVGLVVLAGLVLFGMHILNTNKAEAKAEQDRYDHAVDLFNEGKFLEARDLFREFSNTSLHYQNARAMIVQCEAGMAKGGTPVATGSPTPSSTFKFLTAKSELDAIKSKWARDKDADAIAASIDHFLRKYEAASAVDSGAADLVNQAKTLLAEVSGGPVPTPGATGTVKPTPVVPTVKVEDAWGRTQSVVDAAARQNEFGQAITALLNFQKQYELEAEFFDKAQARITELRATAKSVWSGGESAKFTESLKGKGQDEAKALLDKILKQYEGVPTVTAEATKLYETR